MDMRVRKAMESDLEAAAQLWFERMALVREADANLALAADAQGLWQQAARQWLDCDDCAVFVAEINDALAGVLVVGVKENPPWIYPPRLGEIIEMALDLHHPHSGLGGAMLMRASAWLRANDIDVLEVQPPAFYPVEETFWRAQGGKLRSRKLWLKL